MQVFELYDSIRGASEAHLEMTSEEAQLRNEDLQEQKDSRRWILCEYPFCFWDAAESSN